MLPISVIFCHQARAVCKQTKALEETQQAPPDTRDRGNIAVCLSPGNKADQPTTTPNTRLVLTTWSPPVHFSFNYQWHYLLSSRQWARDTDLHWRSKLHLRHRRSSDTHRLHHDRIHQRTICKSNTNHLRPLKEVHFAASEAPLHPHRHG